MAPVPSSKNLSSELKLMEVSFSSESSSMVLIMFPKPHLLCSSPMPHCCGECIVSWWSGLSVCIPLQIYANSLTLGIMVLGGETLRGLFNGQKTIINRMTAEMISGNMPSFHLKEDVGGSQWSLTSRRVRFTRTWH